MSAEQFDIVVFGATSFVGQILTQYLFERHGAGGDLRWAVAGRSEAKLLKLRDDLGGSAADLPMIVADAADKPALDAMCAQTRLVISTVGPYALFGSTLVQVCAESGTDYVDLTGEVQWIKRMIDAHEAAAKKSGARIVHSCGFDSIPSDMGLYFLQEHAKKQFGDYCSRVKMRVANMRGAMSGGTVASLMNVVKEVRRDPALRKALADPYLLCPSDKKPSTRQPSVSFAEYDEDAHAWTAPFVMAAINTRIVQRSNALAGQAYGEDFQYDEAVLTGKGFKGRMAAASMAAGMGGFMAGAAFAPTRWVLERFVVPKPGEGPSPEAQRKGRYDLRFIGKTQGGKTLKAKVTGDRDPGYGSTAKMLGEAGVCLANDITRDDLPGGFWTPATAFGDQLIERLTAHAGLTFELLE